MKKTSVLLIFILLTCRILSYGQDPQFSQFFSSPLNINPALTANINADWRIISNLRDQWIGPASPYLTGTVSFDTKLFQNKIINVEDKPNTFGIGGMLMMDHAMQGIARNFYASANLSYNIKLLEGTINTHRFGIGFGTIYADKYVDFSRLDFEEQWVGYGFNTNLPTGEAALSNMKPYFSISSGAVYTISSEKSNFDIGVAGFHLNTPKQTFLEDENQELVVRRVFHANYERFLNNETVLNTAGVYQYQGGAEYFSIGGGLGYFLNGQANTLLNVGVWYWSRNAIIPYVGIAYKDMQFGFSYDITTSKLNQAARKPNTWEVSIILRGSKRPSGVIPCPWK